MKNLLINRIFDTVAGVTGIGHGTIASGSRVREAVYARMIAAYHLRVAEVPVFDIRPLVGVASPEAVYRLLRAYEDEITPVFLTWADAVTDALYPD